MYPQLSKPRPFPLLWKSGELDDFECETRFYNAGEPGHGDKMAVKRYLALWHHPQHAWHSMLPQGAAERGEALSIMPAPDDHRCRTGSRG